MTRGEIVALVVVLIALALLAIPLAAVVSVQTRSETASCSNSLRQIAQALYLYYNDSDSWLVCGGNRVGQHDEPPLAPPGNRDPHFPHWYETLATCVNTNATPANAHASYVERYVRQASDPRVPYTARAKVVPSRDEMAAEIARLSMLFTCPRKPNAVVGYGYHYAAPFGVDAVYEDKPELSRPWRRAESRVYPKPEDGEQAPAPVLWYGQHAHHDSIVEPSKQIAVCDTGLVTNDAELKTPPADWEERWTANVTGYVRFPLCESYKASSKYRSERAWRPVARHEGKVACLFFDGHCELPAIESVAGPSWGERGCLFDNVPSP